MFRTLLIVPYAVAPAIAGVLWIFLFNPTLGIVSHWLRAAGVEWNHVLDGGHAMILIVVAAVWKQISYNFIFFLAGLQSIPKSLIEAAAIDGAGAWRTFRSVIFPLLSPTTFFLLVVNVVYAFFDTFAMSTRPPGGGPAKATEILVYKVYKRRLQGARHRRLGRTVGDPDGYRPRAHRHPVSLCRTARSILRTGR